MKAFSLIASLVLVSASSAFAADCSMPEAAVAEVARISRAMERHDGDATNHHIGYVRADKGVQIVATTFDLYKAPDVTVQVVSITELNADCTISSRYATETKRLRF